MEHGQTSPVAATLGPFLLALGLCLPGIGCGSSGSGGGDGGPLLVVSATAGSGPVLPWDRFFIDERIVLQFSGPVDPSSVGPDTIQIRSVSSIFTVPARGSFVTLGNRVEFVPEFPARADLGDAGLVPGEEYRVLVPGGPTGSVVRSAHGERLADFFETCFTVKTDEPLLLDPVPGPPSITTLGLDLDGDGVLDADGNPTTPAREELLRPGDDPLIALVPVGLARAPLLIGIFIDEPVRPESVFLDANRDGELDHVRLVDARTGLSLPAGVELEQRFVPAENRFEARILVIPETTLPPGAEIELRVLDGIADFATPPQELPGRVFTLVTESGPATFRDELTIEFHDTRHRDPSSTAEWDTGDSNVLEAGLGLGGTGALGPLTVGVDDLLELDTRGNDGIFHFTTVTVAPGATLRGIGPHPLRLFATSDVVIEGTLDAGGEAGRDGKRARGDEGVGGGRGGPGGGRGGDANVPSDVDLRDDPCQRGRRGTGLFEGSGGDGGKIHFVSPGGGGGGGHTTFGSDGQGLTGGEGGRSYPASTDQQLTPGSGGGGGGDGSRGVPPEGENTGGGGGGGGGAVLVSTAGRLALTGVITCDGGPGGKGGRQQASLGVPGGGGGGGGSAGTIHVRAVSIDPVVASMAGITARGGPGGEGGEGAGQGGRGARGRVRIDALDTNGNGLPDEIVTDPSTALFDPAPVLVAFSALDLGRSEAISLFLDTGTPLPRYSFTGSDPLTGLVQPGGDLQIPGGIPPAATVRILFEGAHPLASDPRRPDRATASGFRTDIRKLSGLRFVRFKIVFTLGERPFEAGRPIVSLLRIPFEFDI